MELMKAKRMSKIENGIQSIEKRTVPMFFEMTPNALNRIVFTMVRRIIGKMYRELIMVNHLDESGHKLGSATMIFRAIIEIDKESTDIGKAFLLACPEISQTINDKITGHFRLGKVEKKLLGLRDINAKRSNPLSIFPLKVMVKSFDSHSTETFS